ncbi:DNA polymerase III subunit delta [Mangrovibacillus cuniculi]|uniref:DNA polymerase III subunit delta n=1 Tax=Mangrovibacillus cuniculi TaxID=2593652 RepID=A0A7S8CBT2_9BACI|nr:DNA polymerase III subunit delta [Mangrovibacillus cuniculi]QPC46946.1 DNA polymerase III subunit delta [Mangrovibacillus cuniculi]
MIAFWKSLQKEAPAPIYLIYGKESYLIGETKNRMMIHFVEEESRDFNVSIYDMEETPIEVALSDAETLPFFGERKVIFIERPHFLTSEKSKSKVEHDLDTLLQYIQSPSPYASVVFLAQYEKLDERKKVTKLLKKQGVVYEASLLNADELTNWVNQSCAEAAFSIQPQAIELLLYRSNFQLQTVVNELAKLMLYAQDQQRITYDMVEDLTPRSLEQNVFELVECTVNGEVSKALRIYHDLRKMNEEPLKLLALLAGQFRLMYQVKALLQQGYGQPQIAKQIGVHPFRVKLAAGKVKDFPAERLQMIMTLLAEADLDMKRSTKPKDMILELLIVKFGTSS